MMGSLRVAPAEEEDDARDSARLAEPADPEEPATPRSRVALEISARLSEQREADSDQGGTAADAADADASLRPPRRLVPLS